MVNSLFLFGSCVIIYNGIVATDGFDDCVAKFSKCGAKNKPVYLRFGDESEMMVLCCDVKKRCLKAADIHEIFVVAVE